MKKKELQDLFSKSVKELQKLLTNWTKEMLEMRLKLKAGKLKDVHAVKKKRQDIAKIRTIIAFKKNTNLSVKGIKKEKNHF